MVFINNRHYRIINVLLMHYSSTMPWCTWSMISTSGYCPPAQVAHLTAVRVRLRGRLVLRPAWGGMMRRLATITTSFPLNFFSSSRTSRCWILWNCFSRRYGTWVAQCGCAVRQLHAVVRPGSCTRVCGQAVACGCAAWHMHAVVRPGIRQGVGPL